MCAAYKLTGDGFYVSAGGKYMGIIYEAYIGTTRPIRYLKSRNYGIHNISYSPSKKLLLMGTTNGKVQIRSVSNPVQ